MSTTILLQDGPFLCLRLGLIIHYKIISQSNVFFTTKNFLVVVLQLYRVCVIMIEHRKRSQLAQFNTHHIFNQAIHSLPFVPKKTNNTKKRRTGANVSTSNGNLTADPTSMKNHRTHSLVGIHDLSKHDGFSDPLSRKKRSSGSSQNLPSLPPPRTSMSHSRSLTTVNQTNLNLSSHKICTAV